MLRDKRVRFAVLVGVLEWFIVGGAVAVLENVSTLAIGAVLLVATWLQIGALFYRPRPKGAFADAQQLFMQGDYPSAAAKLEGLLTESDTEETRTLLGNTYRQMGRLEDSEKMLRAALSKNPTAPFPLYGLGRTLLAQGKFAEAAELIRQALENNGRKAVRAELALAHFMNGDFETAAKEATRAAQGLGLEPYRVLMVNYILRRTQDDQRAIDMMSRSREGLAYWKAEADRFSSTDYGQHLWMEIQNIEQLISLTDPTLNPSP